MGRVETKFKPKYAAFFNSTHPQHSVIARLGFSAAIVASDLDRFKAMFSVLRDERGVLDPWQAIALQYNVMGKQAHDAHLVAAMHKHGLTHVLTFNAGDFQRYSGVVVLDPMSVAAQ